MTAKKNPAPATAGREWSCGYCAPAGTGICHDRHGKCREVWGAPYNPYVPPTVDVSGEVLCACAMAGHPQEAVIEIVRVDVVELPQPREEVA